MIKPKKFKKQSQDQERLAPRTHPDELAKTRSTSTTMYYRPTTKQPSTLGPKTSKKKSHKPVQSTKRTVTLNARADISRLPSIIILCVFAVLIFFASTLSGQVVVQIGAEGYEYRPIEEYQQTASQLLTNGGLSRSKLLFRSDRYEQEFLELFPELESATALLPLGGRDLSLRIRTSEPLAKIQSADASAKIVNTTGALVELAQHSSDTQILPLIILDGSYAASLSQGDQVLTQAEVQLVEMVLVEFTSDKISSKAGVQGIERITISITDGEMLVYLRGVPYYVKLSSYNPLELQVGAAVASLIDLTQQGEAPLEYLDARVPGRVFVK